MVTVFFWHCKGGGLSRLGSSKPFPERERSMGGRSAQPASTGREGAGRGPLSVGASFGGIAGLRPSPRRTSAPQNVGLVSRRFFGWWIVSGGGQQTGASKLGE